MVRVEPFAPGGADAFAACARALCRRPHVFLRIAHGGPLDAPSWSFAASDPVEILSEETRRDRRFDPFGQLARRWSGPATATPPAIEVVDLDAAPGSRARPAPIPFQGGFAGYIGYEARSAVERIPPRRLAHDGLPACWLGRYDAVLARDAVARRTYLCGVGPTIPDAAEAVVRLLRRIDLGLGSNPRRPPTDPRPRTPRVHVRGTLSPADYRGLVGEVRARIGRGDLFQANVSQRFEGRFAGAGPELFDRLIAASPTPYATYVELGRGRAVLSTSPERFLARTGDVLETRPMKGTRRRGATPAEDRALARDLERSEKDRAELAMIVDLARNDLARSCRPGSVRVVTPRRLERYATVHQAVGVVTGRLRDDVHPAEAVRRAFPPGSVTGAPKVEAMRVIDALEREARGPYCGAIGWFDERGDFDLAVAIRTAWLARGRVTYRVGGGVTWLSDPEAERVETLHKGVAIARALGGER